MSIPPSAAFRISALLKRALTQMEGRTEGGDVTPADLDLLEQIARINKLNLARVSGKHAMKVPEEDDTDPDELEKELRALSKAANPNFFEKRGRKRGPVEQVAPPPPRACERIHAQKGLVCRQLQGHRGNHLDGVVAPDDAVGWTDADCV